MDFSNFKALSFDCYGTLVDWEKGITTVLTPWVKCQGLKMTDEEILVAFAKIETVVQKEHPTWEYPKILKEVAVRFGKEVGVEADDQIQTGLAYSVGNWPAFTDTREALLELSKHYKLIILSNIDKTSFEATNKNQLNIDFYKVLTAQKIGSFKPDKRNFQHLIEELRKEGIEQNEILHVAQSLYHDMEPASALGFSTVWINRRANNLGYGATPAPLSNVKVDLEFPTMGAFASFIKDQNK